jgi:hypothetical protein
MKIKALNGDKTAKYGYEAELGYDNPKFHGHQIGICIGVIDNLSGKIVRNALPDSLENRDEKLLEILADNGIIKVESPITQLEDDHLVGRTVYYLPYSVEGHSIYEPTCNFTNIVPASNVVNHVTAEILFVEENLNRYVVYNYDTVNISLMDIIHDMEIENIPDVVYQDEDAEEGEGYYLDFYDEAGTRIDLCFPNWERLRDSIASVRLLNVITEIEKEK